MLNLPPSESSSKYSISALAPASLSIALIVLGVTGVFGGEFSMILNLPIFSKTGT